MTATKKLYRVTRQFHYPTAGEAIIEIQQGRRPSWGARKMRTVEAGDVIADLPGPVVQSALQKGWVEEVGSGVP